MKKKSDTNKLQLFLAVILLLMFIQISALTMICWKYYSRTTESGMVLLILIGSLIAWGTILVILLHSFYIPLRSIHTALKKIKYGLNNHEQDFALIKCLHHYYDDAVEMITEIKKKQEHEYSMEMLKKQAELNALQSQINPHFLYNTLDSIRGQLMMEGMCESADILESLSNLFRYSISLATYNTLEQELDNVENYMRIMRYRFGSRFTLFKKIDYSCDYILNCEIPKLTLQPIVENAIKHGLEKKESGGVIIIRAFISDAGLHISVEDNGVGINTTILDELNKKFSEGSPVQFANGSGIALVNVNERIRLLYGDQYGLYVNSIENVGTEVHILLPARITPIMEHMSSSHTRGDTST